MKNVILVMLFLFAIGSWHCGPRVVEKTSVEFFRKLSQLEEGDLIKLEKIGWLKVSSTYMNQHRKVICYRYSGETLQITLENDGYHNQILDKIVTVIIFSIEKEAWADTVHSEMMQGNRF